ncbi:hypothetical protein [Shewanella sp. MBTL60-007]|uniref:hypothetical protein n=1 Tax=Shewanella sp. MBTL60-007 TaxID=2815911 RepID=UPI001BB8AC44|nr:hypothetical protein [Shewanella sp. MBTL60-007]GIU22267.1 hypothetical protein TUM3792_24190 [Shewanella sp. MBTL60-007]
MNAESPVTIEHPKNPNRVVLRFSESWGNLRSPIKIRFEGEQPPQPPIRDGGIGLDIVLAWLEPLQTEAQLAVVGHTDRVANQYQLDWLADIATQQQIALGWHLGPLHNANISLPLLLGAQQQQVNRFAWALPVLHQSITSVDWLSLETVEASVQAAWAITATYQLDTPLSFDNAEQVDVQLALSYLVMGSDINQQLAIVWGPHQARWICSTKYRPPAVGLFSVRFSESALDNAQQPITLRFTESDRYCYFDDGGGLVDGNPSLPDLDFKVPIEPQIRRAYLMQPTLTCTRVSDSLAIVLDSVSFSDSRSQYAQSVNLQFSSAIDASNAENELLLIDINGYEFFALAEQPSTRSAFGTASYSSAGRSRSALLSTPWRAPISYTNDVARSFAGLLGDLLTNSGWSIELVGITDFTVPAGAFSIMGKSPIDAVSEACAQIGCMVIPDEFASKLSIVPRWPTSPWAMDSAIADINIHDSVIMSYSSQKQINQACNAAWVRGEQKGVSAKVKRAGTAGDIATADITAQLIVDNKAARLAGTNVIADTGNKQKITVTLPLMADLPPLKKGMLIGVTYQGDVFKATCDSVSISASMDINSGLDVIQTVTLIRHL